MGIFETSQTAFYIPNGTEAQGNLPPLNLVYNSTDSIWCLPVMGDFSGSSIDISEVGGVAVPDPSGSRPVLPVALYESAGTLMEVGPKLVAIKASIDSLEGGYTTLIGKPSLTPVTKNDFTVTRAGLTSITISNLPSIITTAEFDANDIEKIDRYDSSGVWQETYTRQTHTITYSDPVITVSGISSSVGDTFVVYTNVTTAASSLYPVDSAYTAGDVMNFVGGVRMDTAASLGATDGDYVGFGFDSTNHLWVHDPNTDALATNMSVAHDDADDGNPIKIGAIASASSPADVDEGDRVNLSATLGGKLRNPSYDDTEQADKVIEQSPERNHRTTTSTPNIQVERLAAAGAGTTTEYLVLDYDTYKHGSIQVFGLTGSNASDTTTITAWGSNDSDVDTTTPDVSGSYFSGTKDAYTDISLSILRAAQWQLTGSGTEDNEMFFIDTAFICEYIVIKIDIVKTDGVGDGKCDIFAKEGR